MKKTDVAPASVAMTVPERVSPYVIGVGAVISSMLWAMREPELRN